MINDTIIFTTYSNCGIQELEKHGLGVGINNLSFTIGKPLEKVFKKVIYFDVRKKHAEYGIIKVNNDLINLVRKEHPNYLFWASSMYEILESTFDEIQKEGTIIIGWFLDDECRFDDYSKWWIPYLTYVCTTDIKAVKKFQEFGITAFFLPVTASAEIFYEKDIQKSFDVSFVGTKFGDRGDLIEQLNTRDIKAYAVGKGWNDGFVSVDDMVNIYNASKINLCFTKSYCKNGRPQLKDKIFQICMSRGFLLCEYVPGIEEIFTIDKEIVCFKDIEEADNKIQFYLNHESERQKIACAGWERVQRDYEQSSLLFKMFESIKNDNNRKDQIHIIEPKLLNVPKPIRKMRSDYYCKWGKGRLMENYKKLWNEDLKLSLHYNPLNGDALSMYIIGYFPSTLRSFSIICSERIFEAITKIKFLGLNTCHRILR